MKDLSASAYVCNDGTDNDGDGLIDADDPACEDGYGSDETDPSLDVTTEQTMTTTDGLTKKTQTVLLELWK